MSSPTRMYGQTTTCRCGQELPAHLVDAKPSADKCPDCRTAHVDELIRLGLGLTCFLSFKKDDVEFCTRCGDELPKQDRKTGAVFCQHCSPVAQAMIEQRSAGEPLPA